MAVPAVWRVCVGTELPSRGSTAFSHPAVRDRVSSRAGFGWLVVVVLMPPDIQSSNTGNKFCCSHFRAVSSGCQKNSRGTSGFWIPRSSFWSVFVATQVLGICVQQDVRLQGSRGLAVCCFPLFCLGLSN